MVGEARFLRSIGCRWGLGRAMAVVFGGVSCSCGFLSVVLMGELVRLRTAWVPGWNVPPGQPLFFTLLQYPDWPDSWQGISTQHYDFAVLVYFLRLPLAIFG